jgi:hypothetical protein
MRLSGTKRQPSDARHKWVCLHFVKCKRRWNGSVARDRIPCLWLFFTSKTNQVNTTRQSQGTQFNVQIGALDDVNLFKWVLRTVHCTHDYMNSVVWYSGQNTAIRMLDLFPSSGEGVGSHLFSSSFHMELISIPCLWLAQLTKCLPPISPEEGNGSSSRNVTFCTER